MTWSRETIVVCLKEIICPSPASNDKSLKGVTKMGEMLSTFHHLTNQSVGLECTLKSYTHPMKCTYMY